MRAKVENPETVLDYEYFEDDQCVCELEKGERWELDYGSDNFLVHRKCGMVSLMDRHRACIGCSGRFFAHSFVLPKNAYCPYCTGEL